MTGACCARPAHAAARTCSSGTTTSPTLRYRNASARNVSTAERWSSGCAGEAPGATVRRRRQPLDRSVIAVEARGRNPVGRSAALRGERDEAAMHALLGKTWVRRDGCRQCPVPPAGTVMLAALKVTDEAALRKLGSERVG